jgi:hypothetical protein
VEVGITRLMFLVVPAAVICGLALSAALVWLEKHLRLPRALLGAAAFLVLAGFNLWMLRDALVNGPLWYSNYGLGGMQYGARQLFGAVHTVLDQQHGRRMEVSPSWANGTDAIARFFFNDPLPFQVGSIRGYFDEERPELADTLFVMIPEEYSQVLESPKFRDIRVEQTLPYPNGQPGFYFVRLRYVPNIAEILAAERAERRILREETVMIDGQPALVKYSYLDIGEIQQLFDGDDETLLRTMEANPFQVQVQFSRPRRIRQVWVRVGGVPSRLTLRVFGADGGALAVVERDLPETSDPRTAELDLPAEMEVSQVRLEALSSNDGEPAHVHLWEMKFK